MTCHDSDMSVHVSANGMYSYPPVRAQDFSVARVEGTSDAAWVIWMVSLAAGVIVIARIAEFMRIIWITAGHYVLEMNVMLESLNRCE